MHFQTLLMILIDQLSRETAEHISHGHIIANLCHNLFKKVIPFKELIFHAVILK